jgi:hypothetical protein
VNYGTGYDPGAAKKRKDELAALQASIAAKQGTLDQYGQPAPLATSDTTPWVWKALTTAGTVLGGEFDQAFLAAEHNKLEMARRASDPNATFGQRAAAVGQQIAGGLTGGLTDTLWNQNIGQSGDPGDTANPYLNGLGKTWQALTGNAPNIGTDIVTDAGITDPEANAVASFAAEVLTPGTFVNFGADSATKAAAEVAKRSADAVNTAGLIKRGFDIADVVKRYGPEYAAATKGADLGAALDKGARLADLPNKLKVELGTKMLLEQGAQQAGTAREAFLPFMRKTTDILPGTPAPSFVLPWTRQVDKAAEAAKIAAGDKTLATAFKARAGWAPTIRRVGAQGERIGGALPAWMPGAVKGADQGGVKFMGQTIIDAQPAMDMAAYNARMLALRTPVGKALSSAFNPVSEVARAGDIFATAAAKGDIRALDIANRVATNVGVGGSLESAKDLTPINARRATLAADEALSPADRAALEKLNTSLKEIDSGMRPDRGARIFDPKLDLPHGTRYANPTGDLGVVRDTGEGGPLGLARGTAAQRTPTGSFRVDPVENMAPLGLNPADVPGNPATAVPSAPRWQSVAAEQLQRDADLEAAHVALGGAGTAAQQAGVGDTIDAVKEALGKGGRVSDSAMLSRAEMLSVRSGQKVPIREEVARYADAGIPVSGVKSRAKGMTEEDLLVRLHTTRPGEFDHITTPDELRQAIAQAKDSRAAAGARKVGAAANVEQDAMRLGLENPQAVEDSLVRKFTEAFHRNDEPAQREAMQAIDDFASWRKWAEEHGAVPAPVAAPVALDPFGHPIGPDVPVEPSVPAAGATARPVAPLANADIPAPAPAVASDIVDPASLVPDHTEVPPLDARSERSFALTPASEPKAAYVPRTERDVLNAQIHEILARADYEQSYRAMLEKGIPEADARTITDWLALKNQPRMEASRAHTAEEGIAARALMGESSIGYMPHVDPLRPTVREQAMNLANAGLDRLPADVKARAPWLPDSFRSASQKLDDQALAEFGVAPIAPVEHNNWFTGTAKGGKAPQPKSRQLMTAKEAFEAGYPIELDAVKSTAEKVTSDLHAVAQARFEQKQLERYGTELGDVYKGTTADIAEKAKVRAQPSVGYVARTFTRNGETHVYQVPEHISKWMDTVGGAFTSNNDEAANFLLRNFDRVQNLLKRTMTTINPGFHGRNLGSNVILLATENIADANGFEMALKAYTHPDELITVGKGMAAQTMTGAELLDRYSKAGIKAESFGPYGAGKVVGREAAMNEQRVALAKGDLLHGYKALGPSALGTEVGSFIEDMSRVAGGINAENKGASLDAAALLVDKALYNYAGGFTKFDRDWMKRLVPFWGWMKQNIPHMAEFAVKSPGKIKLLSRLRDLSFDLAGVDESTLPDYMREMGMAAVPGMTDANGNPMLVNPNVPMQDLLKWNGTAQGVGDLILGNMSPILKTGVIELPLGVDTYTGKPLAAYTGQKTRSSGLVQQADQMLGGAANPEWRALMEKLGFVAQKDSSGNEYLASDAYANKIVNTANSALANLGKSVDTTPNSGYKALSWLSGLKLTPYDPKQMATSQAYTRDQQLADYIRLLREQQQIPTADEAKKRRPYRP